MGWLLDNAGLKLYSAGWPTGTPDRRYAYNGIYHSSGARTGTYYPLNPAGIAVGAFAANTDYIFYPHGHHGSIPSTECCGYVIRGYFAGAAGVRLYVFPHPGWGYESGGSAVILVNQGSMDFGPWVIPTVWGTNYFYLRATGAVTNSFLWITGYYR
jgi:hypothetical protein